MIIVAVIYLPSQLGGWGHIFDAANDSFTAFNTENADAIAAGEVPAKGMMPPPVAHWAYASLALGSALALFMYPHSVTAVLSTKNRSVIRRNAALLPAYSFLLGLLALLGFVAIAAAVTVGDPPNPQRAVPQLFENEFPPWFAGVGLRGHRHRRARARGHHGDRRGQPVDPQHLQGVHQARRDRRPGGPAEQGHLAAW